MARLSFLVISLLCAVPRGLATTQEQVIWTRLAASPCDSWTLERRALDGGSELRLREGARERWRRELAAVPEIARVTEAGHVALTGTRAGQRHEAGRRQNYFVLAILDPWGQLVQYQHVMQRGHASRCGSSIGPTPRARALIVDARADVIAVSLAPARLDRGSTLWLYRLSTGEYLGDLCPREELGISPDTWFNLRDVRFVPGRRMIATLWSTGECAGRSRGTRTGDTLALVGIRGGGLALQAMGEFVDPSCVVLDAVEADCIRLRTLGGDILALELVDEAGAVRLEQR